MKIAIPTNNKKRLASHIGLAKGFLIVDTETNEEIFVPNPILDLIKEENINLKNLPQNNRGLGVGRIIPPLLKELGVEAIVSHEFGEGMLMNLEYEGIKAFITDKKDINEILSSDLEEVEIVENRAFSRGFNRFGRFNRGYGFRRGRGFRRRFRGGFI